VSLEELGLRAGEKVRFRRPDRSRWQDGVVLRREADGSLRVRDENGAARTIPLTSVEVRRSGRRGAALWEPLLDRAGRSEQLGLFDA
jgi:hypothetical protein